MPSQAKVVWARWSGKGMGNKVMQRRTFNSSRRENSVSFYQLMKSLVLNTPVISKWLLFGWQMVCRWDIFKYFSVGGPLDIWDRKIRCFEDCFLKYRPHKSHDPFCNAHSVPQWFWQLRVLPCCLCPWGGCDHLFPLEDLWETPAGGKLVSLQKFHRIHILRVVPSWSSVLLQFKWRPWILTAL